MKAQLAIDATTAPMWFGDDADDAHRFVLGLMGWMLEGLDDDRLSAPPTQVLRWRSPARSWPAAVRRSRGGHGPS
jgi:hypothetical protein